MAVRLVFLCVGEGLTAPRPEAVEADLCRG